MRERSFLSSLFLLTIALLIALGLSRLVVHAQSTAPSIILHVAGQSLSSTAGYLNTVESGAFVGTTHTTLDIGHLTISNADSVSHNITITDCQSTPAILFSAAPIAASGSAGSVWTLDMGDARMVGCAKFQVDAGGTAGTVWVWMSGTR
jgi:hypothetical protein